jgi:ParB-like chromosome segregation protein Spo0J
VVDAEHVIVVGHTRWKAAKQMGLAKVPVHVATDLSAEQIKAYRIADNQTATLAEWDYDLLPLELSDLQSMNYELGLLGFAEDELNRLLASGDATGEGLTDEDDIPDQRGGDADQLQDHRQLQQRPVDRRVERDGQRPQGGLRRPPHPAGGRRY